jgi:hypothetical protein
MTRRAFSPVGHLAPLVVCFAFALVGVAKADVVPIPIFNTGVDGSGTVLPDGTLGDPHYTLMTVPSGSTAIQVRTSAGGFPIGPWIGDDSLSAWIRPNNPGSNDPGGTFDYQTTFDLTGLNPATAVLIGQWATDNQGSAILINGVSTGQTAAGFTGWSSFTLSSGFIAGVNTLDFIVYNVPQDTGNPTGLRVEMSGTAAVPEPSSLAQLFMQFGIVLVVAFGANKARQIRNA